MSILLPVNPPYAGMLVDGLLPIKWKKTQLPLGKAYIYETKKNGGCGEVIGEVEIFNAFTVDVNRVGEVAIKDGKISRLDLQKYAKGKMIGMNFCDSSKRYDKPISVRKFRRTKTIRGYHRPNENFIERLLHGKRVEVRYIDRPPRSWCYIDDDIFEKEILTE